MSTDMLRRLTNCRLLLLLLLLTDCFERYQSYAIKLQNVVCCGSLYVDILWNIVCLRLFSAYLHLELDETCQ